MVTLIRKAVSNPFGAGLSAALLTGFLGYTITDSVLQGRSKDHAVFFAPKTAYELDEVTNASARIQNLSNDVGALYVQLCRDDIINDFPQKIDLLIWEAEQTKMKIAAASEVIKPFSILVHKIRSGGNTIGNSYVHRKDDNYHTEVYTEQECTTTNDQTTCSPETRTR